MTVSKVFISYSHQDADKEWRKEFVRALEQQGVDVWLDEERIRPGDTISDTIEAGLRGSDTIIYLINPKSVKSANLYFELGAAMGMNKRLVAIVPQDIDLSQLPQPFRVRKFLWRQSPQETANAFLCDVSGKAA